MKSVVGRRVFVGTVVGGLPLIAGVGAGVFAQSRAAGRGSGAFAQSGQGAAHVHTAAAEADPVADHLLREMAAIYNRSRQDMRGEDARAFAAHMRTLVVHARRHKFDDHVKASIREAVEREGRYAILWREPNAAALRTELERYGVRVDPGTPLVSPIININARTEALDIALREGLTGSWERIARVLDAAAPELDRRAGHLRRVALGRNDEEWRKAFCESLAHDIDRNEGFVGATCAAAALPWIGEFMMPSCVAAAMGLAILKAAYAGYC